VYRIFTVHVSTENPGIRLSNPESVRSGIPGRITIPFTVSNIPDGTYPAWVLMHYPSGIGLANLYPEGYSFYSTPPLWLDGEVTITNGMGEVAFVFDGSFTREKTVDFHFGIDMLQHGTILDDNRIRIH
jgi:hypothetical protein